MTNILFDNVDTCVDHMLIVIIHNYPNTHYLLFMLLL